jgi:methyl-accepting chemotaxis protein
MERMDSTMQLLLVIFVAVAAFSLLLQVLIAVGMAIATRRMQVKAEGLFNDLRIHVLPILSSSRTVIEDLTPKIKTISTNLTESSNNMRTMAGEVTGVVGDVAARTRAQAAHVEDLVDGTLDRISFAGNTIQHGISMPVRQVTGIVNGIRAGLNVMCGSSEARRSEEKDLFV